DFLGVVIPEPARLWIDGVTAIGIFRLASAKIREVGDARFGLVRERVEAVLPRVGLVDGDPTLAIGLLTCGRVRTEITAADPLVDADPRDTIEDGILERRPRIVEVRALGGRIVVVTRRANFPRAMAGVDSVPAAIVFELAD